MSAKPTDYIALYRKWIDSRPSDEEIEHRIKTSNKNYKAMLDFFEGNTPKKAAGTKNDAGKIRPSLIPVECLELIAEVLTDGAIEYAPDNWKQVEEWRYHDAMWRHWIAWQKGEKRDAKSGHLHAAHFATNALFLLWFEIQKEKKEDGTKT